MYGYNDPAFEYNDYARDQADELERFPVCCECKTPIQTDEFYEFDGRYICTECLEENHKRDMFDYVSNH